MPPVPAVKDLISNIRSGLARRENKTRQRVESADRSDEELVKDLRAKLEGATKQRAEFETMMKNVPDGFDLVPVFYSKISKEKNEKVYEEYLFKSRRQFLTFVAENYANDLKKMGLCDHAIGRMKQGLDATDKDGKYYLMSIDHIVERSGSGTWGRPEGKSPDPDRPNTGPRFPVNHFGNFILLPAKVHDYKNKLNDMQRNVRNGGVVEEGNGEWMLMMVPKRDNVFHGFVCPPQPPGHPLHGLDKEPPSLEKKFGEASYAAARAADEAADLATHPLLVSNDNGADESLKSKFNAQAAKDPALQKKVDILRPHLTEATTLISKLYNEISLKGGGIRPFAQFFQGKNVRRLREAAGRLPLDEARSLTQSFQDIEHKLPQYDTGTLSSSVRPANDTQGSGQHRSHSDNKESGHKKWHGGRSKK